ncbi:guanine nucleotide binding protein, alpha subunit [Metschnikowia bicuspidata var. bicuspidata NRRL YB-4993]|uniref:Guanine nucleotide binding protein, alpha subunit n=1 Tax=Metschnikowia bicuspidata var. bicuspidata NRRL YB-4993 TaxID=869754 RepID=A0A1A0H6Q1_9ASCO|nr:guanine nucleotide binding protein, alpha subunit [Metschnikowia bicuspidata var. bicuspidata NRRL YB-4993]OBA19769.1 guanine nucleotide binding protein, alpha subunit [Metschnikowia bicuspidata var. bicuspidata NRRL YB-4993]
MGCVASTAGELEVLIDQQRLVSDAIDRSLNQKKKQDANLIRLFLLGAGDSGKSTVLKQMRLLHNSSFTDFERKKYSDVIWVDMIESMKMLLLNARKFKIPLDCDRPNSPLIPHKRLILATKGIHDYGEADESFVNDYAIGYGNKVRRSSRDEDADLPNILLLTEDDSVDEIKPSVPHSRQEIARAITELWNRDKGVKACFDQAHKFQLESSALYYFDNASKFQDPNYCCTDRDIIMGRIKTTGITQNTFHVKDTVLKVLDAGGQRSERKKWIHFFQDINAIIFVLAVLEYDQTLYEDGRVNRIDESFALFESLCNAKWFVNTPFILFLNKVDLLERKLPHSPFQNHFPDYNRDPLDVGHVLDYFEESLLKLNRTRKPIYVHRTCATDTDAMRFVLNAVTDMMIQQNLKQSGLM